MAKRGRKSVYDTKIKPRFDDILKWLRNGATEKQVYEFEYDVETFDIEDKSSYTKAN